MVVGDLKTVSSFLTVSQQAGHPDLRHHHLQEQQQVVEEVEHLLEGEVVAVVDHLQPLVEGEVVVEQEPHQEEVVVVGHLQLAYEVCLHQEEVVGVVPLEEQLFFLYFC